VLSAKLVAGTREQPLDIAYQLLPRHEGAAAGYSVAYQLLPRHEGAAAGGVPLHMPHFPARGSSRTRRRTPGGRRGEGAKT
jgi:hypothetical protein